MQETSRKFGGTQPVYLPTPAEIEAACLGIRLGWSNAEERRRVAHRRLLWWTVPVGKVSHESRLLLKRGR